MTADSANNDDFVQRDWVITKHQKDYLAERSPSSAARSEEQAFSQLVERLIRTANTEDRQTKKMIFKVVRCHQCHQSSTGGVKATVSLSLPKNYVLWLEKVKENCDHASVDKSLRILLDFYIGICTSDSSLEKRIMCT